MRITADEFFNRYADGERDFFGIKLVNADLSRASWDDSNPVGQAIIGAILGEGDLSGTDFRANDMRACNFGGSKLVGCRFDGTNLTKVSFRHADLTNASFVGANLTRTDLSEANLTGADFTGADLTGAKFPSSEVSEVLWDEGDDIKNWVIQTVQYYRQIDFFLQHSALSDEELANILKHLCRKEAYITGGKFDGRGDWEVIRYDLQRILGVSLDAIRGDDPGEYSFEFAVVTLQSYANISRGLFQPIDIRDVSEYLVEFTLNGSRYTLNPWEDPHQLALQINPLLSL
jgi:Pentapeptide repeats (9 copies)